MAFTDQQLRQELISYGESVPPITQRNREQLRARLELLRSQARTRTPASPSRSQVSVSPSKSQAAASPSRKQATASPLRSQTATASPSRVTRTTASPSRPPITASPTRANAASSSRPPITASPTRANAASPSRSVAMNSPSRTRSSATNTTVVSRPSTRSKQATNLIELSDSETDSASTAVPTSRTTRSGQATPNMQTRSTGSRRQQDSPSTPSTLIDISAPPNITNDVEQSIARHRREIKQLLDSARDRNRVVNASLFKSTEPIGTPIRPVSNVHTDPEEIFDNTKEKVQQSPSKFNKQEIHASSSCSLVGSQLKSFWSKRCYWFKNLLKLLFITCIFTGTAVFIEKNYKDFLPFHREINCSAKNATVCEDMIPLITAIQNKLQARAGEVNCNFRPKSDLFVKRAEIEKYLNALNLKFNLGDEERWNTLVTYILNKPLKAILTLNENNVQTKDLSKVKALSTEVAARSILCWAQQDISSTVKNLIYIIIGSTGLIILAWYLRKLSGTQEDNEQHFKNLLEKVTKSLEEQYEKHLQDPKTQPWLAINQIREKFISEKDEKKLKHIWERIKSHINNDKSQITYETQQINGEEVDVWRWTKSSSPMKTRSKTAKKSNEETDALITSDIGLTECLKLRNCFRSNNYSDEKEIDQLTKAIRDRCGNIEQIEHIGIHSIFVYVKFSSKEAAGQAYDLLNNWNYQGRIINVKYIRHSRYNEHFPEARNASSKK